MSAITPLTAEQRAAVVFVSLEPSMAESLADRLGPDAVERVKRALQSLTHVPRADLLGAFALFLTELESRRGGLLAGEARAAGLLRAVLGDLPDPDLIDASPKTKKPTLKGSTWKRFALLEPDLIAGYIEKQGSALGAIMLSRLGPEKVAEVLSLLPQDIAVEIIDSLARESQPTPTAFDVVENMIAEDLLSEGSDVSKDPRLALVGEMLGTLPRGLREAALNQLTVTDAERADVVRQKLLSLDDIPVRLPTRSVPVIFRDIDNAILIAGLKAAEARSPDVANFLLSNITQRMGDKVREQIADAADMDDRQQDRAAASLLREILGLNRSGAISLTAPPSSQD